MAGWRGDLEAWLSPFLDALGHAARRRVCPAYVAGLIEVGERKSMQPMALRDGTVGYDQLHHFIAAGTWTVAPLELELVRQADRLLGGDDAVLIVDDTTLPKKGTHSVGVAPQYAAALGKTANCQTLVSLTMAAREVPVVVGLRLLLPESWTRDPERLIRASVPQEWRVPRTKPEIALVEIDRLRATGLSFGRVLADAGYGLSAPFRQGLSARGLAWAVGIPHKQKVYPADVTMIFPLAGHGRPRKRHIPDVPPVPAQTMLENATWRTLSWRCGRKGRLSARFAALRVRVADGKPQRIAALGAQHLPGEEVWLIGEHRRSGGSRSDDQSAMGLRTGPSADERGARPRSLRRAILAGPPSPRSDDHDRLPPSYSPAASPKRREKKEPATRTQSQARRPPPVYPPYAPPSSPPSVAPLQPPAHSASTSSSTIICQSRANREPSRAIGLRPRPDPRASIPRNAKPP